MTEKQLIYAKRLQEELKALSPVTEVGQYLSVKEIKLFDNPRIINQLLITIREEEYLSDSAFEGSFMQE